MNVFYAITRSETRKRTKRISSSNTKTEKGKIRRVGRALEFWRSTTFTHAHDSFLCNNHQRTHHESTQICSFRRSLAMLYISCLQPTGVSPALNNRRRASSSSSSYVSQQKTLMKKKKKEEESAACQFTFLLDKPGCMDARMDEDEPCDVNLECPLEPFDISKCLKRHKGVLKMGVNHAVRFTLNAENLFVSPLPGSTIFLDDEVVTDKMTKMLEDGSRLRFAKSEYVLISEGFCPLPSWDAVVSSR